MKEYIIFGSGGFAKELVSYMASWERVICAVSTTDWDHEDYKHIQIKQKISERDYPNATFLMAVADPALKRKFVSENPDRWATYVHWTAVVSKQAKIGRGSIICPQTVVTSDAQIGQFVTLNLHCTVSHDCEVGDFSTFSPYASIMGHCKVGKDAFFGAGALCVPQVTLPDGTKVSAGAVVRKSMDQAATLYGDPAKPRGV